MEPGDRHHVPILKQLSSRVMSEAGKQGTHEMFAYPTQAPRTVTVRG